MYKEILNENYKDHYDMLYTELGSHLWLKDSHWEHANKMIGYLNPEVKTVLDAGCGDGVILCKLMELGYKSIGCDVSDVALVLAKSNILNKIGCKPVLFCANFISLPFLDNSFDAVIFSESIEHLKDSDTLLTIKELIRVAKPGAQMIISSCNRKDVELTVDDLHIKFPLKFCSSHIHERTESELTEELSEYISINKTDVSGVPVVFKLKWDVKISNPKIYITGNVVK